jgi:chromosome segregation protein
MKLKALEVHGFKSFADSTEIEFHEGITAVVGPNGCGKSNIGDAIRWVLGEQRPTAIRGAKMEEAIFQGSVNRRPVNRGSVSLVVSNEDGALPVPFEEVEIGRTVYRDGGSDYTINRSSCRLRDVLDLCRDTGLGANAYAIIENRMIDAILSDRAEERRGLFEEAAGIGKYKDRRKAASRRLERAELDLQRLDDVIGEVQTKVRSLARQKGKAQRFQALRERRLSVEVSVVRRELDELRSRLREVERELEGDREMGEGYQAELRAAEAQLETLRLRQVEAQKARTVAAATLEEIRDRLVQWEKELAVAAERAAYARRRLGQIDEEEDDLARRLRDLEDEEARLVVEEDRLAGELARAREEKARREEVAGAARQRLEDARRELARVESRLRDLGRRQAELQGEASSAEGQAAELGRHLERLQKEMEEAATALSDVAGQGDLFADRLSRLEEEVEGARRRVEEAKEAAAAGRQELEETRERERRTREVVSTLEARIEALEGMERSREGLEPTVKAALALDDPEVLGTLGTFVSGDPAVVRAVEVYLGPFVQGLVVRDEEAVARLHAWYREEWEGRGGLILFPLDRVPEEEGGKGEGGVLEALTLEGEGAPWVRALLRGVGLGAEGELPGGEKGRASLSLSGAARDGKGVVRLGNPLGSSGILERRERVKALRKELEAAENRYRTARERKEAADSSVRAAEATLEEAWAELREAEDAFRSSSAEAEAQSHRRERLDRQQEELARQIEGTRATRVRALDRAGAAREDADLLETEAQGLREEETEARARLERTQDAWEEARAEESRLALEVARTDGERERLRERLESLEAARAQARKRASALGDERTSLEEEEEAVAERREEGARATEELFGKRDEAEADLREKEGIVAELSESVSAAEGRVREARSAEREALDHRHRLELEEQNLTAKMERIRDRLEGEWGRSLEALMEEAEEVVGDPEELREELREIVGKLEKIGPVNMLAVEEHEEESARLEFLLSQRDDLREARDDLRDAIRQINETATRLFQDTFEEIRDNFRNTFRRLFEGGEADLWLEEGEDPLESLIEIHASPRGKKTQRIDLLSGGERALTALSLLFGIYLVKPSPFCVLDEVDAPLDESNIYRFVRLLQEFKDETQFIVITHNPRTIEAADWIYGVTMEEPGVSRIVGVRLEDALQASGSAA